MQPNSAWACCGDSRNPDVAMSECRRVRQNVVNDARYLGIVKVHYAIHGLLGKEGKLVRRVRYGSNAFLDIDVDGVRHTVHEWMTNELHCQSLTYGHDPVSSFDALHALLDLFDREL